MSIDIRESDWRDPDYDECGNTNHYILEMNGIRISLCNTCLDELIEEVEKVKKERTETYGKIL